MKIKKQPRITTYFPSQKGHYFQQKELLPVIGIKVVNMKLSMSYQILLKKCIGIGNQRKIISERHN